MLVTPVQATTNPSSHDNRQIECLARNAYFEARGEGVRGQEAVSHVVMNRVRNKRFAPTACDVIYQRNRGTCQFSWVCTPQPVRDRSLYEKCKDVAKRVYYGRVSDSTNGALFFRSIRLGSIKGLKIGNHLFYR